MSQQYTDPHSSVQGHLAMAVEQHQLKAPLTDHPHPADNPATSRMTGARAMIKTDRQNRQGAALARVQSVLAGFSPKIRALAEQFLGLHNAKFFGLGFNVGAITFQLKEIKKQLKLAQRNKAKHAEPMPARKQARRATYQPQPQQAKKKEKDAFYRHLQSLLALMFNANLAYEENVHLLRAQTAQNILKCIPQSSKSLERTHAQKQEILEQAQRALWACAPDFIMENELMKAQAVSMTQATARHMAEYCEAVTPSLCEKLMGHISGHVQQEHGLLSGIKTILADIRDTVVQVREQVSVDDMDTHEFAAQLESMCCHKYHDFMQAMKAPAGFLTACLQSARQKVADFSAQTSESAAQLKARLTCPVQEKGVLSGEDPLHDHPYYQTDAHGNFMPAPVPSMSALSHPTSGPGMAPPGN